eukprot:CAMPEP_0182440392 /NCGR_PEP_ID=MMETSP1167-20130531/87037_1 /TAXON_ID=2988 /ORGANISM="Mallomonas Sp, Strain CCMP3275" /LENGTH=181 /DNA_ID=CAMNT_0024634341 /DNA_START=2155 /DNA_END=2700 /DNA_ORIENTATION=+
MYDAQYPDDEEVDQVTWKAFWLKNQHHHTICLACITQRKERLQRGALSKIGGLGEPEGGAEEEEYPDWGPVFLSAASKAILLNWYRKAKIIRSGKRGMKKQKVVKDVSDDEGEDMPAHWAQKKVDTGFTPATTAIATRWARSARAQLQRKAGKGAGPRESDSRGNDTDDFRSGLKSRERRK